jgi:Mn2+/Fe2+ NRAMP family transporter
MSADRASPTAATEAADFQDLELPTLGLVGAVRHFGPGMILMMTGIGTSHLVTAPVAGGRFEYALLWCIPVAYVFKYYGFEMAFRFTHATGRSMLDAYATARWKWPLHYVLVTTLIQCAIGQAGRLIAVSAVVYFFFVEFIGVEIPTWVCGLVLGTVSVAILLRGRYSALELSAKVTAGILFVSALVVYCVKPAPLSSLGHLFILDAPVGSWLIIAGFLGLLPTGIDVSLQASEWGRAKRVGTGRIRKRLEMNGLAARAFDPLTSPKEDLRVDVDKLPPHAREYCRRWFTIGLWDFRVGHFVSFLIACIFLLLAAVWLYPSEVEGRAVMGEIATIFTRSVGPWMMVVFLVGAFFATFSTAFNYFDGWPRVVAVCCRNIFPATASLQGIGTDELTPQHRRTWYSEYNLYRGTMFFSLIASVAIIAGVPKPVWLVLVASALAFFIAPVIFLLNLYYCLTVIPKNDPIFYPSKVVVWLSGISFVIFTGLSGILILARVVGIQLFG